MTFVLLFFAACFLAYSNGANDNFKGVASLYGSKTCSYRTALTWATTAQLAGSVASNFPCPNFAQEIFRERSRSRQLGGVGLFPTSPLPRELPLL